MSSEDEGQPVAYYYPGITAEGINFQPSAAPQVSHGEEPSTGNATRYTNTPFTFEAGELPSATIQYSQMRRKSPPLDGNPEDNPLTWHESEITGHDPNDPNDDGYGVNGIGYKPTPAQAWARSQRKKQQLAEYKSREAREARQRRSERRRMESRDASPDDEPGKAKRKAIRVHFEDV
jgi:nucleolar protein 56